MNAYAAAWSLYCDWATATGRNPYATTPSDLEPFIRQNPCARSVANLRARAIGIQLGWVSNDRLSQSHRAWPDANEWLLPLDEALAQIDISSWPRGFRGRRDAFLLVLVGHVGLTRRQALDVRVASFERVATGWSLGDHLIPRDETLSPARCTACAVSRWFAVLGQNEHWSSKAAREFMIRHGANAATQHPCVDPMGAGPDAYWREAHFLLPSINPYGMTHLPVRAPMSERAVTTVLASRRVRSDGDSVVLPTPPAEIALQDQSRTRDDRPWAEVDQAVDEACDRADEINARMDALFADTAALLAATGASRQP